MYSSDANTPAVTFTNLAVDSSEVCSSPASGHVSASSAARIAARNVTIQQHRINILSTMLGSVDMIAPATRTPAQAFADLEAYAASWRVLGGLFIAHTIPPTTQISEANWDAFNALVRAGSPHFDAVVDLAALWVYADASNATKFPDGLHPAPAQHALMAAVEADAIQAFLFARRYRIDVAKSLVVTPTADGYTTNGTSVDTAGTAIAVGVTAAFNEQGFIGFDTSSLSATRDTVTSVLFRPVKINDLARVRNPLYEVYAFDYGASIDTADHRSAAQIAAMTRLASWQSGSETAAPYVVPFTSDAAFADAINKGGTTKLLVVMDKQRTGAAAAGEERIALGSVNHGTSTSRPSLTINYKRGP
jgi:lysophospholipase L1-like esterase